MRPTLWRPSARRRLPASLGLALNQLIVCAGIAVCARLYHDVLCSQFLLTRELQRSKDERIEQLACEKERLGCDAPLVEGLSPALSPASARLAATDLLEETEVEEEGRERRKTF